MSKIKSNIVDVSKASQSDVVPKKRGNYIFFSDFPEFKPNLSPKDVFQMGSFGGTYYRPIYSQVVDSQLESPHEEFPEDWFKGLDISKQGKGKKTKTSGSRTKTSGSRTKTSGSRTKTSGSRTKTSGSKKLRKKARRTRRL